LKKEVLFNLLLNNMDNKSKEKNLKINTKKRKRPQKKKSDIQRRYDSHPHVKARQKSLYTTAKKKDIAEYWKKRKAAKRARKIKKKNSKEV